MRDGKTVLVVSTVEPDGLAARLSIQVGSVFYRVNQIVPPSVGPLAWFDRMLTQLPYPRVFEFLHPILEARQIVFPPLWEKATAMAKPLSQAELYTDLDRWSQSEDLVTRVLDSIQVLTQKATALLEDFVASERFVHCVGDKPEVGKEVIELFFRLFDLLPFRRVPDTLFEVPLLARSSFPALYECSKKITASQVVYMYTPELLASLRPLSLRIKAYRNFIKLRTKTRRVKRAHPMGMYNQLLTLFTRQYTRMLTRKLKVYANSEYSLKARLAAPLTSAVRKQVQRALKLAIQRHEGGQNALRTAFTARLNHFLGKLLDMKSQKLLEQKTVSVMPAHEEASRRVLLGYQETLTALRAANEARLHAYKQSLRSKDREVYLARVLSKQLMEGAYADPLKAGCLMLKCEDALDFITDLQNITYKTCRVFLRLHVGEGKLMGAFAELDSTRTRLLESRRALQDVLDSLPLSSTPESSFADVLAAPLKEFLYWFMDMRSQRASLQLAMHAVCSSPAPCPERPDTFTFMDAWALASLSPKRHEHTWGETFCTECGEEKPEVESESEEEPETVIERYVEDLPNPFAIGEED